MNISKKLWKLLGKQDRRSAILLLVLMIIGMVLETVGVAMVLPALSVMTDPEIFRTYPALFEIWEWSGRPNQSQMIVALLLALIFISLVKAGFMAFLAWRQAQFVSNLQLGISQKLFEGYLRLPWTFHMQRNSSELIRNVTTEIHGFSNGLVIPSLMLCTEITVLFGIALLLLTIETAGTLAASMFMGGAMLIYYRLTRGPLTRWGEQRQYHEGQRIKHIQQALGSVKDVMLLGREAEFIAQYRLHNEKGAHILKHQTALAQLPRIWLELLAVLALAVLGLSMLIQGKQANEIVPVFGMFAAAAFRLLPSASRTLWALQSIRFARPIIATLTDEIALIHAEPLRAIQSSRRGTFGSVKLSHVSFAYPGTERRVLSEISIAINKGSATGIIGESGAGKSTLVDILLGLIKPTDGCVLVDGENIQKNLRDWQRHIGYVPQTIYLTDDSIRRNIAFGLSDQEIDAERLLHAAKSARLEEFIEGLPEGMETQVGERGVRLSGGQRQRIGIARALYHEPDLLVLDEATSALDNETERDVMEAVRSLKKEKTIIIIAHRLTTLADCDVVYRISNGQVMLSANNSSASKQTV